jgi:hypothetical protein
VCCKPCWSCWSFHLYREEFLSTPIHSPSLIRRFDPSPSTRRLAITFAAEAAATTLRLEVGLSLGSELEFLSGMSWTSTAVLPQGGRRSSCKRARCAGRCSCRRACHAGHRSCIVRHRSPVPPWRHGSKGESKENRKDQIGVAEWSLQ